MNASKNTRVWTLLALLLSLALVVAACGDAADEGGSATDDTGDDPDDADDDMAEEPYELRMAYPSTYAGFVDVLLALEDGIFADHGLEVDFILVDGGTATVQTLLAGEVDVIRAAGPAVLAARVEGAPLKWIADMIPVHQFKIFAQPEITDPQQLEGASFGISRAGASTDFAARQVLEEWGLDPENDVRLVEVGSTQDIFTALRSGSVDAGIFSAPATVSAEQEGYTLLLDLIEGQISYPFSGMATTEEFAEEEPDVLRRLMAATQEAVEAAKADPDRAAQLLNEQFEIPEEEARIGLDDPLRSYPNSLAPDPDIWGDAITALAEEVPAAADFDINELLAPEFAQQ